MTLTPASVPTGSLSDTGVVPWNGTLRGVVRRLTGRTAGRHLLTTHPRREILAPGPVKGGGMNPQWERATQVCPSIDLPTDLLEALRAHAESRELGPVEAQALVCFQTQSRRIGKAGLLMKLAGADDKEITQAVIVTPTRLVWAQRGDGDAAPGAHSQLLSRLDVIDYEKSPAAQLLPDHGLEIHGIEAQGGHVGTLFFGMGEGPDADHARQVLKEAVRAAQGEGPRPAADAATAG